MPPPIAGLNYWRYISHFRSIHRGQFFTQLRTTTVRKLLPDAWGFLCPVHTPDGSPCGLLNHLTRGCTVAISAVDRAELAAHLAPVLAAAGAVLLPLSASLPRASYLPIVLDATVLGAVHVDHAADLALSLRAHKLAMSGNAGTPDSPLHRNVATLEIALVTPDAPAAFPALLLAAGAARFCRVVRNMHFGALETIGPLEQTTLRIAYAPEDYRPGETSVRRAQCATQPQ